MLRFRVAAGRRLRIGRTPGWRNWYSAVGLNPAAREGVWVRLPPRALPAHAGRAAPRSRSTNAACAGIELLARRVEARTTPRGRSPGTPACGPSAAATRARTCCCGPPPASRSPAAAKASTDLAALEPHRAELGRASPAGSVVPVSSANSRSAQARGILVVVVLALRDRPRAGSLRAQNGPPGWTSRTSRPGGPAGRGGCPRCCAAIGVAKQVRARTRCFAG